MPKRINKKITRKSQLYKIHLAILFCFAFFLYANTINHEYTYDDDMVILSNKYTQSGIMGIPKILASDYWQGSGLNVGRYRPFSIITFAIEKEIFQNNSKVSHFINVLLYGLTATILFLLLIKLLQNHTYILPFTCAILFIAHPIHTEVVASIKSRDEIFYFLFLILSLYYAILFYDNNQRKFLILSVSFYFLGLLSKESSILFIGILLLILYFFRSLDFKRIRTLFIALLIVTFLYIAFYIPFIGIKEVAGEEFLTNYFLTVPASDKYATIVSILGKYIQILFLPHPLIYDYSYNQIPVTNWSELKVILSLIVYIGLIILSTILARKKNIIAFGIIFYIITILPASNL